MNNLRYLSGYVIVIMLAVLAATACGQNVLVLTGGEADAWRGVNSHGFGEHLLNGPDQLAAARTYYYKGLTRYPHRFERYLAPMGATVTAIDLDRGQPEISLDGVDLVVLDDIRASAFAKYQTPVADFVRNGGRLLVVAGRNMLGGREIQTLAPPTLPNALLFNIPPAYVGGNPPKPWCLFTTLVSWKDTPLMGVLPVEIISQPDLIVYDRNPGGEPGHEGGRPLAIDDIPAESFLAALPMSAWGPFGYHKIRPVDSASIEATIGPERDPLVVRGQAGQGEVLVVTVNELDAMIRGNGKASASTIVTPESMDTEKLLWDYADVLYLGAAASLLGEVQPVNLSGEITCHVGQNASIRIADIPAGAKATLRIEPVGPNAFVRPFAAEVMDVQAGAVAAPTADLPEGDYRAVLIARKDGKVVGLAAMPLSITSTDGLAVTPPDFWTVPQGQSLDLPFTIKASDTFGGVTAAFTLMDMGGKVMATTTQTLGEIDTNAPAMATAEVHGNMSAGNYMLTMTLRRGETVLARPWQSLAVRGERDHPELFMMIAGDRPSWPVLRDIYTNDAVMTVQEPDVSAFLPWIEQYGGIPRATTEARDVDEEMIKQQRFWRNAEGEPVTGGWGSRVTWADPVVVEKRTKDFARHISQLKGRQTQRVILLDDEPSMAMAAGYEAADAFKAKYNIDPPKPERRFDDADYLETWTLFEDFRAETWRDYYASFTEAAHELDPRLQTAVVVEGMGKDIYAGFNPAISQSSLDIYWYHIYPLNEPLTLVAHAAQRGQSAMRAIGKKMPTWALLQNWADDTQVPHIPPAEYIRNQYWMAVSHGIETVGYWPYAYGWWSSMGTPGWEEMGRLATLQQRLMPLWQQLSADRKPIALLYSTSQGGVDHLRGLVAETPQEGAAPWHNWHANEEAYFSMKKAKLPFETLEETELVATGGKLPYQAIVLARVNFLRRSAVEALEAFHKAGGEVWLDESSQLELPFAKTLPTNFDQLFCMIFPPEMKEVNRYKHFEYYKPVLAEHIEAIRPVLAKYDPQTVAFDDARVVWNTRTGGEATYLFVVNDAVDLPNPDTHAEHIEGWRMTPNEWHATTTTVSVPDGAAVYDVLAGKAVEAIGSEERQSWQVELPPAGGKVYALLPRVPAGIAMDAPMSIRQGETLMVKLTLLDADGEVIAAALPITVTLAGKTVRTATGDGEATANVFVGADTPAGEYEIIARDTVTGATGRIRVKVTAADMPLLESKE